MKNFLISAIVIIVLILIGVFVFGDDNNYVAGIENDVNELEAELVDVQELIASDELTEEEATAAYEEIVDRLNSIEASVEVAQGVTLTDEEKQQLVDAFQQLAEAVSNYSDVLNVLEETANVDTTETIVTQLSEVVVELEDYIDAVDADEVSDTATSSEEASDEEETPMMEDGTLTEEDMSTTSTSSEEEATTEN